MLDAEALAARMNNGTGLILHGMDVQHLAHAPMLAERVQAPLPSLLIPHPRSQFATSIRFARVPTALGSPTRYATDSAVTMSVVAGVADTPGTRSADENIERAVDAEDRGERRLPQAVQGLQGGRA